MSGFRRRFTIFFRFLKRGDIRGLVNAATLGFFTAIRGGSFKKLIKLFDSSNNANSRDFIIIPRSPPKVSIIVPNCNHDSYLAKRLDSIYGQTYKNVEVILLDDASSDNSRTILNRYQAQN